MSILNPNIEFSICKNHFSLHVCPSVPDGILTQKLTRSICAIQSIYFQKRIEPYFLHICFGSPAVSCVTYVKSAAHYVLQFQEFQHRTVHFLPS